MKVTYIINQLAAGGAERVCINIANLLHKNGIAVTLVVFNKRGRLFSIIDKGIRVVVLNKHKNVLKASKQLAIELKNTDIAHVHMYKTYQFVKLVALVNNIKTKIIIHDHFGNIQKDTKVPLFYKSFLKPHFFVGVSSSLTNWATNKAGFSENKVHLIGNFVVKSKLAKSSTEKKGFVLVGNLREVKNHKFAIRFAATLNKSLTIYCAKKESDYYKELLVLAEELNYKKLHFKFDCLDVQSELNNYEMGLMTSIYESGPLVLIEFLAQGLPSLNYNTGEVVKIVNSFFPDFVVNDFDIDNWVYHYEKALLIKSNNMIKLFDSEFSSELYLEKYLKVYKKILKLT